MILFVSGSVVEYRSNVDVPLAFAVQRLVDMGLRRRPYVHHAGEEVASSEAAALSDSYVDAAVGLIDRWPGKLSGRSGSAEWNPSRHASDQFATAWTAYAAAADFRSPLQGVLTTSEYIQESWQSALTDGEVLAVAAVPYHPSFTIDVVTPLHVVIGIPDVLPVPASIRDQIVAARPRIGAVGR